jgi:hypothetical protein
VETDEGLSGTKGAGVADALDTSVVELRRRYLVKGTELRVSNVTDSLGGYTAAVIDTNGLCWISTPMRRDGMLDLGPGELVSVRFDREGDAAYLFDTVVAEVREDDAAPYGLAWPLSIDRRSHRADVRLALVLDATYRQEAADSESWEPTKVVDVSASGLALICDEELDQPTDVTVRCDLPHPQRPVHLEQRAEVRTRAMYGRTPAGTVLWRYGVQLHDVDDALRDDILGCVLWNLTRNPRVL